jgi:sarcosine oxidase, subunit alpha
MNRPYRLTPIHEWHQRHGAHMAEISGWNRVLNYGDLNSEVSAINTAVGLCDASPLSKVDVQGKHSEQMLARFMKVPEIGECASAGLSHRGEPPAYVARLTRDRFIFFGEAEQGGWVYERLKDAASGYACVHVTDLTSAYTALHLAGPSSTKLLKKLGPARIDSLKDNRCLQSPLARVVTFLIRRDVRDIPAWLLLFSRDYGEYVWECILSAGHEFGIRPFGTEAQRSFLDAEAADVEVV